MKNIPFLRSLIAAAAVAALPLASHAQVVSDTTSSGSGVIFGDEPLGQSFTAIASDLTSFDFDFLAYNPQFSNGPITISILNGAGTSGSVVESETFTLANGFSGYAGATFADPASLSVGDVYTAVITGVNNYYWGIGYAGQPSTYTGGVAYLAGTPQNQPYYHDYTELQFEATFGGGGSSVPDSTSTIGLLGIGLVAVALVRRRSTSTTA